MFYACKNPFLLGLPLKGSSFGWHHSKESAAASGPSIASHLSQGAVSHIAPGPPQLRGHPSPWMGVAELQSGLAAGHFCCCREADRGACIQFNGTQECSSGPATFTLASLCLSSQLSRAAAFTSEHYFLVGVTDFTCCVPEPSPSCSPPPLSMHAIFGEPVIDS